MSTYAEWSHLFLLSLRQILQSNFCCALKGVDFFGVWVIFSRVVRVSFFVNFGRYSWRKWAVFFMLVKVVMSLLLLYTCQKKVDVFFVRWKVPTWWVKLCFQCFQCCVWRTFSCSESSFSRRDEENVTRLLAETNMWVTPLTPLKKTVVRGRFLSLQIGNVILCHLSFFGWITRCSRTW